MNSMDKGTYFPPEIKNDLAGVVELKPEQKQEILASAWEYARCVTPHFTNWNRYIAYVRLLVTCVVAEFRGDLIKIEDTDEIMGYNVGKLLEFLFGQTPDRERWEREFRAYLLITAEKTSDRRGGELFRRYVNALAYSPAGWYQMRGCDALVGFTIAASFACNDMGGPWLGEGQVDVLVEIAVLLYDSVAFYKHRAEGEVHNTFAYLPPTFRVDAHREARDILWGLDAAYANDKKMLCAVNFIRWFGGPLHMVMRRYRFVEENLSIGTPENQAVLNDTKEDVKLWKHLVVRQASAQDMERYESIVQRKELMYEGLPQLLEEGNKLPCKDCVFKPSYGVQNSYEFGGVKLCTHCQGKAAEHLHTLRTRAIAAFPLLQELFKQKAV
ncbi:BcABA3 [Periconia macrospinosa]|uniref:BcABA3 n=1 Tax=Periconia macrospinosa TaxID=97972 RepID=A0A2V1E5A8_9PLEO|nr:BcABA3 [Periconia macrospinosa]